MTHTPSEARRLIDTFGLTPRRSLGQHFVVDPNTVRRIVRQAAVGVGDRVVEVGAGLGSLTLALAETGAEIVAVEADAALVEVLESELAGRPELDRVRLVHGDALRLDWDRLLAPSEQWVLVANLPYNVATPLVLDLLADVPQVARMLVMVQREAGERLVAEPGSKAFGVPSVKVAFWGSGDVVGRIGPDVFWPRPKVDSVLVEITRHPAPPSPVDPDLLFGVVHQAFQQRRKMLRSSLRPMLSESAIVAAGVDPRDRPERLGITQWIALGEVYQRQRADGS